MRCIVNQFKPFSASIERKNKKYKKYRSKQCNKQINWKDDGWYPIPAPQLYRTVVWYCSHVVYHFLRIMIVKKPLVVLLVLNYIYTSVIRFPATFRIYVETSKPLGSYKFLLSFLLYFFYEHKLNVSVLKMKIVW